MHNYLGWKVVARYLNYLERDTWESCAKETIDVMGFGVASVFARQNFSRELKILVELMINAMKEVLKKTLNKFVWQDDRSRLAATKEVDDMIHSIGTNSCNLVC